MDVRQLAFLARQPSATLQARDTFWGLSKRGLAFILANMMFWQPVVAMADGIVVNGSGTTLGQAGNGVPIVNIAAPNGSGLSHNQFSDYNVGQQGVILNNAVNRTQQTQLGGIILGNPNLGGRAANVILNEVNGGSPSQLKGYTEVAGQSAHVIVANPYGVTCNGCGFINTPKATLTTGKPVIENGQIQRYQVDQGSVAIEGAGLNASNIDQFEIITRSAKINAEIQAQHLAVIAGANDVDAKTLNATARTANPADAPQLAIDSSALGGMYAGAIKLVGTEAGVGVKLDGKLIASGGDIQLDANGQLRMAEATAEKGAVAIKTQSLEAQGAVYAGTELRVQTQDDLNNHSTLAAANSINLGSGGQLNNHGIIEAGVNLDNSRNPNGDVTLTAQNLNNSGKSVVASRDLTVTTNQTLNNQGGILSGQRQVTVSAATLDNSHQGKLLSAERLQLNADQVRNGQGGLIKSQQSLNATLGHLGNSGGELSSQGSSTLVLAGMDNLTGVVLAQQTLEMTGTAELDNQGGLLSGWQGLTLKGTGLNNSNKGTVSSLKGGVDITLSDALNNSQGGALVSQQALDVKAASLDNSLKGVISSAGAQSLKLSDRLDNSQGGSIDSAATLTLQAMALGNQGGTVNATGDLEFIGSDLDNSHGTFTGKQGVTLDLLGHLINNQGTLSAAGPLLLKRSTKVENQGGELSSQQWLRLFTEHLDNRQKGRVAANDSVLISASGEVQNSDGGEILSREADLQLNADHLDNAKGLLQAKTTLGLEVAAATGNQGGQIIAQQGDLTLKAGHLDNRAGKVSALNGGATLETAADGRLDNRDGALFAQQGLHISAKDLDNSAGQISARQIELELAGALDNRQGLIESRSTLATAAASLDNQRGQLRSLGLVSKTRFDIGGTFDNRDGLLETANHDLDFDAGGFNNRGGSLLHSGSGVFGISMANLEDVGGRLKTAGQLTLEAERWTNSSAIQADQLLVKVDHLTQTADGQLLAGNGLTGSGIHWSNDGLIGSDAALNLDLSGNYSGKGRLSSLGQLDLHAAQLDLADSASIAGGGNSTLKIDGALNSAGRITAKQNLHLTAASINNHGTLGSGEDLNLTAATLVNDHGLISSGGNMQLLTTSFTNRYAQVYSLGTALIAKDDQQTRADLLDNRSGDIESLGKLSIAASTVNNVMDVLEYTEHEKSAASITRLPCEWIGCDDRGGGRINGLWEVAETDRLRVTNSSAAASLNSGADLQIDTQVLTNTSSLITAAGDINVKAETVHNQGLQPQEITTLRRYQSYVNETGNAAARAAAFNARNNPTPSASFASDLSAFIAWTGVMLSSSSKVVNGDQSFAATIQAGGKVNLKADKTLDNSVIRSFYEYVGAGKTLTDTGVGNGYSTPIRINPQLPPELAQQQVNPLVLPGFTLPTSGNGLFRLSGQGSTLAQAPTPAQIAGLPDAASLSRPHKYLIETNPALTNLKQFMSSDYLLSHLGYNPDESAKRLGDGFYEQKLIQQAMVARTGQRFIDGQDSNEKLFKHLMDNAIQSKQQLDLSVGVTLTSEQIAALTHDIVWLESHEVNGEQVLVPVLYLAQANNRLAPNGALIAGKDVSLIAGKDLNNVGTLRAANDLSAVAGENLVNSGLVEAGKGLNLTAGKDLLNKAGGVVAGRDVALTATDGDVVNERTLTRHQSSTSISNEQRDFVDSAARIEAANNLTLTASRDLKNTGSALTAGGDAVLSAGRDLSITSTEQANSSNGQFKKDLWTRSQTTQNASDVQIAGSLKATAGQDIQVVASKVAAQQSLSMVAARDVAIESAANAGHSSFKTSNGRSSDDQVRQQSSRVEAGGDLSIKAGQDLTLLASQVKGAQNVVLDAARDLNVLSAKDETASFMSKKGKGSFGQSSSKQQESYHSTNIASVVEAGKDLTLNTSKKADGGMSINGGRDVTVIGSQLKAGADLMVGATGDVAILSGVEEHGSYSKKTKSGFLGLSKSGKSQLQTTATQVGSELSAGNDVVVAAGNDIRLRASEATAGNDVELRAGLVKDTGDINLVSANDSAYSRSEQYKKKVGLSSSGASVSFASAKESGRQAQSSTSVGSQVLAERDASLKAERDINVVGSGISAGRNVSLDAGRDVNVVAAQNSSAEQDWKKSKQVGVGVSSDDNGVSLFAGAERNKEKNRVETQTAAASQISAGADLTVNAKRDINQIGSDLRADHDINLVAGRDIKIDAAREVRVTEQQRESERNGLGVTLNHNYGKTKDAVNGAGDGENNTSKASSTLKAVDSVSQFLAGPTADVKLGNSKQSSSQEIIEQGNRSSTLQAGNDLNLTANNDVTVKGSQLGAGRDINIKGRDVTLDVAKGSISEETRDTEMWGGIHGGTSGGFKIGVGGSFGTASTESSQGSSTATQLDAGRDINLKASNDLNLIGTQAQAGRNIDLDAGNDLNIRAAQNDHSSENNRNSGGGEMGFTFGSEGVGVYVSVSMGKGNLEREGERQQEAYLYAGDRLGFTSGKDTNISGANLRGDEVIGRVGGDLNVASVADTGKVKGKEFDISVTATFGPAPGLSGSVGYGQTTGKTDWVEEQTRITGKNKVDIRTENHTQIDGALIAADNGNLKLDTGTLGFSDIAGKDKEHGYYLNVGGTYSSGSGTTQDSSQVGKGKEGETGWSVSGWDYQKDREQIVRATVGAGEIVVRKDAETGADSTAGLNRDVSKAYEITKDEESRTDLYASSSSLGAVASPKKAYEQWKKSVELYGEKSRETMVKLTLLLASMGVLIASPDNLQGSSEEINRVLVETENYLKAFSKDENRRAEAIEFRLREQLGDLSSDGEKILLARMKEIVRESPEKSVELTAMISTLRGSPTTAQNYAQVAGYAGAMAALAAALVYPTLTPESQERMRNSANSMIESVSRGVSETKEQVQSRLRVSMGLWELVTHMPFPIHLLDDENRKLVNPIVDASGGNPASGGYAEGGGVITTPHTGGTQLDGVQKDGAYVTPEHKLNPGVMYSESDSSKNTSKNLGSASFDAANGIGTIYSPKVSLSNGEIIFNDFSVGTSKGYFGYGPDGAAELVGPLKQMLNYAQSQGAEKITLKGRYATEEGAMLGTGSVDNVKQNFSFSFPATREGLKGFLKGLEK
ncbi:hemagglutinin repeat-containing protein [Pseudomonas protegens]|uniref:hemagglutinin repeat-containing protein n=1 Tax=Pseudomonas protegens TaxID=380021 RepID=UPI000E1F0B47|nr:hemagglutinin repeat-containing protein [Pseudomonas protegens]AXK56253.1 filamentous hemagglutinin N-terminal domain-containing protein [Pseudomonas protegens]